MAAGVVLYPASLDGVGIALFLLGFFPLEASICAARRATFAASRGVLSLRGPSLT